MILAIAVGALTTAVAMVIGVAAAYLGGLWDSVLNFVTDVLLVIPIFPLLIIVAAYFPNAGNDVLILVLSFTGWSYTARQLRSQAQSLRNRDFLLAAQVRGERPFYIIMVEIIPTMTSLLLASFLSNALYAVLAGSGLQFIGLGKSNNVSWGTTLYWANQNAAWTPDAICGSSCLGCASRCWASRSRLSTMPLTRSATRPCARSARRRPARPPRPAPGGGLPAMAHALADDQYGLTSPPQEPRPADPGSLGRVRARKRDRRCGRQGQLRPGARRVPRDRRRVGLREVHPALRNRPAAEPAGRDQRRQRHFPGPQPGQAERQGPGRCPLEGHVGRHAERHERAQPGDSRSGHSSATRCGHTA